MNSNSHTRFLVLGLLLLLISGRLSRNACTWCQEVLIGIAALSFVISLIYYLKHKKKLKKMKRYE